MISRVSAFVIWAVVAGSAVFWGLRQWAQGPVAPDYAVPVSDAGSDRGDLARLLGAAPVAPVATTPAAPEAASRFRLVGVVAPRVGLGNGTGVALIGIDGKPAKAYRVGARVDGDLVLKSVALRTAAIGLAAHAPAFTLDLPPPPAAATGTLPPSLSNNNEDGLPQPAVIEPADDQAAPMDPNEGADTPQQPDEPQQQE